ncbi:hypothetical protein D6779_10600 [Candidatus Parcubacteria bacterium]|nr:MAG: hypothetical protein D6779_10600 [Candidatus Parcubacteria bacterium]
MNVPRRFPNEDVDSYLQRLEAWLVDKFEHGANIPEGMQVHTTTPKSPMRQMVAYLLSDPTGQGLGAGFYIFDGKSWRRA